jgi:hypothetical protein
MRHPFDGVNDNGDNLSRRSVLGAMAAAAAGLVGLGTSASAQVATTQAIGEEGAIATTLAIGEEGGPMTKALGEQGTPMPATTEPFGEEAGKVVSRAVPGMEDGAGKPGVSTEAVGEEGGPSTRAVGEEGGPSTLAVGEEGGITKALREDGGPMAPTVPVKPGTTELKDEQLKAVWNDMALADPAKGVQACAILYGAKKAVPFLKDNLTVEKFKLPQADEKTLAKLIEALDSDEFEQREKAEADLSRLGAAATAALEKAIKDTKSIEQRMRMERLLEKMKTHSAMTQAKRGLEVLVALRTAEAKELLEKLSKGDEKEWLTQAAKGALERASK